MPTLVTTARQCLTAEAVHALDEAVNVAKRRGHSQTTSLHAISALLSLPSSPLREACSRARNSSYSSRLQFKALDLCLSVSLDRVPSSPSSSQPDDPPISNSLMAAIKRSQANQRRQPDNFHFYQQYSNNSSSPSSSSSSTTTTITTTTTNTTNNTTTSSSMSCVKVELRNLILSILDDPVVSRVFGEAGFRSSEIKMALLRPVAQLFRVPRLKGPAPPVFLCNLGRDSEAGLDPVRVGFGFPLGVFPGLLGGEESCRRIGDVLGREKGRNPLLVGACASEELERFVEVVEKRKGRSFSPVELSGLRLMELGSEVRRFICGEGEKGCLEMRFEDVSRLASQESSILGLVLNLGDLNVLVKEDKEADEEKDAALGYVVAELTRILSSHGEKRVWVICGVERYEIYLKVVAKFPSIEKGWDLQLIPITSSRSNPTSESYPRSRLMGSFVPFGGFFSSQSDLYGSLSTSCQRPPRCNFCNERCEREILAVSNGGFTTPLADQYQSSLPPWLQMAELGSNKGLDAKVLNGFNNGCQAGDDGVQLSARIAGLQKKWDDICWRLHQGELLGSNVYSCSFPTIVGFQLVQDKKDDELHVSKYSNVPTSANKCADADSSIPVESQTISRKSSGLSLPVVSDIRTDSTSSKERERCLKKEGLNSCSHRTPSIISTLSKGDTRQASPAQVTSVTTDLGLVINSITSDRELMTPVKRNIDQMELHYGCPDDFACGSFSDHLARSSSSSPDLGGHLDPDTFKKLFRALTQRVGWQNDAIREISQTLAHCWMENEKRQGASLRRGIWFHFLGPDRCGKRKIAETLAEIIRGCSKNIVSVDFGRQDNLIFRFPFGHPDMSGCDITLRGKTLVDYIAGELRKKPSSIIFLENVDRADVQTQRTLSYAICTGKFSDSHGREVGISNTIFVTTSTFSEDEIFSYNGDLSSYREDRILRAKGWPLQILIEQAVGNSGSIFVNKRRLGCTNQSQSQQQGISEMAKRVHTTAPRILDLNLPAEENQIEDGEDGSCDSDSVSDSSKAWLQKYFDQVDRIISFKAFDFDTIAKNISNEINEAFHKIFGSEALLDIDRKVMEQLLAAAYLSETNRVVENWVEQVLGWGFMEALKGCKLGSHSIARLVVYEGYDAEELKPGEYLPQKIIIH